MTRSRSSSTVRFATTASAAAVLLLLAGCASAPPRVPPATFEDKIGWILALEDERRLREPPPEPPAESEGRGRPAVMPPRADLEQLLVDSEARVRRRAALAIARVGLAEGVPLLIERLGQDPEPAVRKMAAFGLGLLGDATAAPHLVEALDDLDPLVRGRSAEALSRLGAGEAAGAIGTMVQACVREGGLANLDADELGYPLEPGVEACRLGLYALGRLRAFEPLAEAVLDRNGQPAVRWWPVAYALQRTEDPRSREALAALAQGAGIYTAAFAAQGLGTLKDRDSVDILVALANPERSGPRVAVAAVRALAQIGDPRGEAVLMPLLWSSEAPQGLRAEAVLALGRLGSEQVLDDLLDMLAHPAAPLRAAALRALSEHDPLTFITVLSGLDPDRHWSVRRALASTLATLERDMAVPRLTRMLDDEDVRVLPAVLAALVQVGAPEAATVLREHLLHHDVVVRMAAARELGRLRPAGGVAALREAWERGAGDTSYVARAAVLEALAAYPGDAAAMALLREGLTDRDWAVRVRAAALMREIDPALEVDEMIRPAPRTAHLRFDIAELLSPTVSTQAYLETSRGVVQIELAVLDAPMTVQNFIALARRGFYNGLPVHRVVPNFVVQAGDPRGDSEGGPGYTIRDEINELPYLKGTVGMALDWADTGGSQFFVALGPQPHLDGRYTVFGRVTGGMEVIEALEEWDLVERVRIWDGVELTEE